MDAQTAKLIIEAAGGDAAFARLLGIDSPGAQQRVNNWKRRGIPADVVLKHYDVIQALRGSAPHVSEVA